MPQFCYSKNSSQTRRGSGFVPVLVSIIGFVLTLGVRDASAQQCPPPPKIPVNWVLCGECRGDLNADGLLNELDQIVFRIYENQFPQNPCADFNDNGIVNEFDLQILICLISESNGACDLVCGNSASGSCFEASEPNDEIPGGCDDPDCCATVCLANPDCCDTLWDISCVAIAEELCRPDSTQLRADAGNSLRTHVYEVGNEAGRPNACTNLVVRDAVCDVAPACCLTGDWDTTCTLAAMAFLSSTQNPGVKALPRHFLLEPVTQLEWDTTLETFRQLLCVVDDEYCVANPLGDLNFYRDISEALSVIGINYPECITQFNNQAWDTACAAVASRLTRAPGPRLSGLGSCLAAHVSGGCEDAYCQSLVCEVDQLCCSESWDSDCVSLAANLCVLVPSEDLAFSDVRARGATSVRGPDGVGCGDYDTGSCSFGNGTKYCRDAACCQLICGYEAYCCDVEWDEGCAALANVSCSIAVACGPVPGAFNRPCLAPRDPATEYPVGCDEPECCNSVCNLDTFCCDVLWDQFCVNSAEVLCEPPPCETTNQSCFVVHGTPCCNDPNIAAAVCETDPICCTASWDQACVDAALDLDLGCGSPFAESCFSPHPGRGCSNEDCCEEVCDVDPFCCREEWDGSCVVITTFYPVACNQFDACGDPDARNCFVASFSPGCSDRACCREVCEFLDPWCCDVSWDAICASQALGSPQCDKPAGYDVGRFPCDQIPVGAQVQGCNDPACAAAVCSIPGLADCCTNKWDVACVDAALAVCTGLYECPAEGDCYKSRPEPGCDDPACCNAVCEMEPTCCSLAWDNSCTQLAFNTCLNPSNSGWQCPCEGSCFEARPDGAPTPGCDDASCCAAICNLDPLCCTVNWDATCAELALVTCGDGLRCGSYSTGSCLEPSETPFCDDSACCDAVCAIDPSCCNNTWDAFCVATALDRCRRGCGVPSAGSCFFPHLSPGCSDSECCTDICLDDPVCCEVIWDSVCAETAIDDCNPPKCGDFPAGDCCVPNESPSCNDKRCCTDVCATDPFCCDTTWDQSCVQLARQSTRCGCGANWNCGDPCAGECCSPNGTPKCNDEDCCDAVCAIDVFCCDENWDLTCANLARSTPNCTGPMDACPAPECGDPDAGDCCTPNGTPSCSNLTCCDQVCNVDPLCCDEAWDSICAQRALDTCNSCDTSLSCGSPDAGPCNVPHDAPYCNDGICCDQVCLFEPFCCLGDWDEFCVLLADTYCN